MYWFTGDHHFNHVSKKGGIIKYCNRPFKNIDEMNKTLINNWNEHVKDSDTVYYLGDFLFGKSKQAVEIIKTLNGKEIIFISNSNHHDKWMPKTLQNTYYFGIATSGKAVFNVSAIIDSKFNYKGNTYYIVMSHFPIEEWNKKRYNSIHLHAHSHGNLRYMKNRIDIGVDTNNFYLYSLDDIININMRSIEK